MAPNGQNRGTDICGSKCALEIAFIRLWSRYSLSVIVSVSVFSRFETGRAFSRAFGPGTGPIWLDDLHCNGSETDIGNCRHVGWGSGDCTHPKDVSVLCWNEPGTDMQRYSTVQLKIHEHTLHLFFVLLVRYVPNV